MTKNKNVSVLLSLIIGAVVVGLFYFYNRTTRPDFKNSDIGKCFELENKTPYLKDSIIMITKIEKLGYHAVNMITLKDVAIAYPTYNRAGFLRKRYVKTKCPSKVLITQEEAALMMQEGTLKVLFRSANVIPLK